MTDYNDDWERDVAEMSAPSLLSPEQQAESDRMISAGNEKYQLIEQRRVDSLKPSAGQDIDINRLYELVRTLKCFPSGDYDETGHWVLNQPQLIKCLRGHRTHAQQAVSQDFIIRFVVSLGFPSFWDRILEIYTGGVGIYHVPQSPRSYTRKRSNGKPLGRPRKHIRDNIRRTSIILTNDQFNAIKASYRTIQEGINKLTARTVALYQQRKDNDTI